MARVHDEYVAVRFETTLLMTTALLIGITRQPKKEV
jgi:hypothetical protein